MFVVVENSEKLPNCGSRAVELAREVGLGISELPADIFLVLASRTSHATGISYEAIGMGGGLF